MAGIFSVFTEGSLFKRTVVHVVSLVGGSVAFIAITSLILVSAAKSFAPGAASGAHAKASAADISAEDDGDSAGQPATAARTKVGASRLGAKKPTRAGAAQHKAD